MRNILTGFLLVFMCLFSLPACTTVDPGNVGVQVCWGAPEARTYQPGFYLIGACSMHEMSTRTQTYTMAGAGAETNVNGAVAVLSRDQLSVSMDVSVQFHLNPAQALEVFNKLGPNYDDTIVHPLVRTAVRDAASEFTATQLVDQRGELQTRMSNLVRHQLSTTLRGRQISESAIVVDNILLRNIDLPNTLDEAIARVQQERQATQQRTQARQTAEQEAARIRIEAQGQSEAMLVRTRADTEAQLLRARAEAESNRLLSQSLTPNILSLRQIEATRALLGSNQTRTIMVPSNAGLNLLMPNLVPTN